MQPNGSTDEVECLGVNVSETEEMDKISKQLKIEEESLGLGIKRYWKNLEKRGEASMPPGQRLLARAVEPMSKALKGFAEQSLSGGKAKWKEHIAFLKRIEDPQDGYDRAAYLVAREILNAVTLKAFREDTTGRKKPRSDTSVAADIIDHLEFEVDRLAFKKQFPQLYKYTDENIRKANQYWLQRYVLKGATERAGLSVDKLSTEKRIELGQQLISIFIKSTGLVKRESLRKGQRDTVVVIMPTENTEAVLQKGHDLLAILRPVRQPMVVKPRKWDSPLGGGYLNYEERPIPFVRRANREYLSALSNHEMDRVYASVNAIQETPWRINRRILAVLKEAWSDRNGGGEYGLPSKDPSKKPTCPVCGEEVGKAHPCFKKPGNKEYFIRWAQLRNQERDRQNRNRSKTNSLERQIEIAGRFVDEEMIFFPHNIDFRGRVYPIPELLNPQGDDIARGLLEFAEGKVLDETGLKWLKVHAANCHGEDKCSLEDRIKWVDEHAKDIIRCANDPLGQGHDLWVTADKKKRYQFLACCFELRDYWASKEKTEEFLSHIPCQMDGSCNGFQHFSIMLRDPVGSYHVNVLPTITSGKPNDLYQAVADKVSLKVEEDANKGNEWAKKWLGKIDRRLVKRNVMTSSYDVTPFGMSEQLLGQIEDDESIDIEVNDRKRACNYLSKIVYGMIGRVVKSAERGKNRLKEIAEILAHNDLPVEWITPMGLWIQQKRLKQAPNQIGFVTEDGRKGRRNVMTDTDQIDKSKQVQAISPNFVHSMDGAHLMRTVLKCKDAGVNAFSMIHDSFGTHASDVATMGKLLRKALIEQYSIKKEIRRSKNEPYAGDVFWKFHKHALKALPKEKRREAWQRLLKNERFRPLIIQYHEEVRRAWDQGIFRDFELDDADDGLKGQRYQADPADISLNRDVRGFPSERWWMETDANYFVELSDYVFS